MNTRRRARTIGFWGISALVIGLGISGCGSGQQPASIPTQSPALSATITAAPTAAPTVQPTAAPENLADAKDLPVWIDDCVHAYGGKVTDNGAAKDSSQLLEAVKANPGGYIEKKTIKGSEMPFFVVNGVPLAIQNGLAWRAILARDLSDAVDAQFALPVVGFALDNQNYKNTLQNANRLFITWGVDAPVVFKDLTTADWRHILKDWETIKAQLDSGQIPNNIPYNWWWGDKIIKFAQENHMGLRSGSLVWNAGVPDAIYNGGFSKAELLKLLEFTESVRLIKYKDAISEWDAVDELIISEGSADKWGFWQREIGLWDATRLSVGLIRKIDPEAKIVITDDHELEEKFCSDINGNFVCLQPDLGIRFLNYVKTLKQEGLVDRVDIENNMWIYDMPSQEYMEDYLRQIQALGVELGAPELTVFYTDTFPLWGFPRKKYTTVDDPLKAQAEGYRRVVQAYINVGGYDIGLGDVGDETSGADSFLPGSSPALFDMQWKPKMGWYEILKTMYAGFLN